VSRSLFQAGLMTGQDVVATRQRGRHIAQVLGFEGSDQVRIATAVSELARLAAAGPGGHIEFLLDASPGDCLLIRVKLAEPPDGTLVSRSASRGPRPGPALAPAQRLVDRLEVRPDGPDQVLVELAQRLPRTPDALAVVARARVGAQPRWANAADELQRQNDELLRTLEELQARNAEVERLNRELEETNRGVVALYAELEEKAEALRKASDMKTRFISNVSHELRTPISSVLNLSRLLLDHIDGPLNPEQEKQVLFIRRSGETLAELIDDLLDLAKIESGRVEVKPAPFTVAELFGALRGVLRPLRVHEGVALVFDEGGELPVLHTDERKLSQILRNLVSNALKFTRQGEVRVSAAPGPNDTVVFSVRDTGIGIPPEAHERIFEEFVQVEGPHQHGVKGTGLGLPLSRRLAELLGGALTVESQPGQGATFHAKVARDYARASAKRATHEALAEAAQESESPRSRPLLMVDDDEVARYLLQRLLSDMGLPFREAANGPEGLRLANEVHPAAIVLDINLPGMNGFEVLEALRKDPATRAIPVIIHTGGSLTEQERLRLAPHVVGILHKSGLTREAALDVIHQALAGSGPPPGGSSSAA
jgi:signal transduction histidine kinase/CheY-like chemotaxis protein